MNGIDLAIRGRLGYRGAVHCYSRYKLRTTKRSNDYRVFRQNISYFHSIKNRIELIPNTDGTTSWYNTTKIPLFNKAGEVAGVGGFTINLKKTDENIKPILKMAPAVDYIMSHYTEHIEIEKLAKLMCLSLSSFERQFKKYFNETPLKYLIRIRLEAACQLLVSTDISISEISMRMGFYDQSHFSRNFFKFVGIYPSQYRKEYAG